nr:MAG TPA: hypothetical protein [Caudoviricetes sp.]
MLYFLLFSGKCTAEQRFFRFLVVHLITPI